MHIGFIGLGHLGRAIAGRLVDCGHSLTVWNRTPGKEGGLEAGVAESPADLAREADIIFLCLFDSGSVRTVLQGDSMGLLAKDLNGRILVDLTTNHFKDVLEFHSLCKEAGATYLEAPVLGSVIPASKGALTVLVSGERKGYEGVKPLLENIGSNLFYLEEPSLATRMKLINNLTLATFMATLAEALSLGEKTGLEKATILEILSVGGGNSLVLNAKKAKLLEEDFSPHFTGSLIYKDLHCLLDLAYESKKALFTGALVKELYARACEKGLGEEDFSAIYKFFQEA